MLSRTPEGAGLALNFMHDLVEGDHLLLEALVHLLALVRLRFSNEWAGRPGEAVHRRRRDGSNEAGRQGQTEPRATKRKSLSSAPSMHSRAPPPPNRRTHPEREQLHVRSVDQAHKCRDASQASVLVPRISMGPAQHPESRSRVLARSCSFRGQEGDRLDEDSCKPARRRR